MTAGPRILVVVVLYRASSSSASDLHQLQTIAGLERAFAGHPELADTYELLLWDNSPQALVNPRVSFRMRYEHAPQNLGVAGAYNAAAEIAAHTGLPWLLLLDDDTSVTPEFLLGMREHARTAEADAAIAAVAPWLLAGSDVLSPQLWRFARHVPLPRATAPYTERRAIFAANSGTLLRVAALRAVGGYSSRFWLDYSDIELFARLHRRGYAVRIASNLELQHEIAMLDYNTRMTAGRYATYLAAESDFIDLYRGPLERALHLLRLAVRVRRQRRLTDPIFSRMSREELSRRIRRRRGARLAERA